MPSVHWLRNGHGQITRSRSEILLLRNSNECKRGIQKASSRPDLARFGLGHIYRRILLWKELHVKGKVVVRLDVSSGHSGMSQPRVFPSCDIVENAGYCCGAVWPLFEQLSAIFRTELTSSVLVALAEA